MFGLMVGTLASSSRDRLLHVAKTVSSPEMRNLPCRAVTTDLETHQFKRRRSEAARRLVAETGVDAAPAGRVTIVTLCKPMIADVRAAELSERRRQRAAAAQAKALSERKPVAQVTQCGADGRIAQVSLPRGGNSTPSQVSAIECMGDVLMLHLERRVNARSITLTVEAAEKLAEALVEHVAAPPSDCIQVQRESMGGSVTVRDAKFQVAVLKDKHDGSRPAVAGQIINLPKGGNTMLSDIESVRPTGPVFMVNLDRRVNARSITVTRATADWLRNQLHTQAPC